MGEGKELSGTQDCDPTQCMYSQEMGCDMCLNWEGESERAKDELESRRRLIEELMPTASIDLNEIISVLADGLAVQI